ALTAGQDTLGAYRHLAPEVARLLNPGGVAVLEIGWTQAQVVSDLLIQAGLSVKAPIRDLAGRDRALVASY
ncbi:MAG: protein-(glutamine-N5) methyltransferase, release factor-specific, partial [Rhodospirillales bacterium]